MGIKYARPSNQSNWLTGTASVPPGPPIADGRATPEQQTAKAVELAQAEYALGNPTEFLAYLYITDSRRPGASF